MAPITPPPVTPPFVRPRPPEAGQSTPLVALSVLLAAAVVLALTTGATVTVDAARARTAADAAALAGAADGRTAAERLARTNGGRLRHYRTEGVAVVVEVTVGRARAQARAEVDGSWCGDDVGGAPTISYTEPPCPSTPG